MAGSADMLAFFPTLEIWAGPVDHADQGGVAMMT